MHVDFFHDFAPFKIYPQMDDALEKSVSSLDFRYFVLTGVVSRPVMSRVHELISPIVIKQSPFRT